MCALLRPPASALRARPPGQGRVAEAAPLLAGAAHALQAALGAAGAAPAGEARFYEALAVAGYGVRGGADADAAEAAMAEARGPGARGSLAAKGQHRVAVHEV